MRPSSDTRWQRFATYALFALLLIRLLAMWAIPLTDTTEARYAEIARKMLETGNWVTLWHDYGVPFWAKPPLSTWTSAASMGLFGVNPLAARLPALLLSLAVLWLVADAAGQRLGRDAALASTLILAGSLLFFGAAGTVMTDPALMFCVALAQLAFWHAMQGRGRRWNYLFFVGLGLGLLAKGPLAIVLVGMPIFVWTLLRNDWKALWQRLPWISGSLLMLAIALPWYLLAEYRTPGFLNYFIMGEHVSRFLDPGWKGDKYGYAHATPRGMIWLYWLGAIFPWSLAMLVWLAGHGKQALGLSKDSDGWRLYMLLWSLMTLLFFTISGNIIFPYPLPMLPGCALLFATLWQAGRQPQQGSSLPWLALVSGLLLLIAVGLQWSQGQRYFRTQQQVIAAWQQQQPAADSKLIYWDSRREFSAEFYSEGKVITTNKPDQLLQLLADQHHRIIVTEQRDLPSLPAAVAARFQPVASFEVMKDHMLLLRAKGANATP
ncbi:ArnT family glycosyltransferase [Aquitalea aquatica]|uniref:Glycosyltransferase family 39 protein n=1 Tax=Aquitalea aquatica TaxID=3044273 RepID=A0A838Y100_9NEIS|nr:glycosyltransferase family 39 protein [Aquitalea magnusonii]MBA4708833.1 glycosyltransferase family 39 protein [Aquitalea magnusonii]